MKTPVDENSDLKIDTLWHPPMPNLFSRSFLLSFLETRLNTENGVGVLSRSSGHNNSDQHPDKYIR